MSPVFHRIFGRLPSEFLQRVSIAC